MAAFIIIVLCLGRADSFICNICDEKHNVKTKTIKELKKKHEYIE